MNNSGRFILVTGCSSGIGHHCAHALKARGWQVIATARKSEDIERLRSEGLETLHLDYADAASIAKCAEDTKHISNGKLFGLFNNGAYGQPGAVEDLTPDVLRAQFEANLLGWHDLTCRLLPTMRANGEGRIVQNSSVLGLVAMKFRGAYVASKFALEGLSSAMRLELAGTNIFVSIIEPGPIQSRFPENALAKFHENIDIDASHHRETYRRHLALLENGGTSSRLKLGPDAVFKKLIHALESPKPRPHYHVTLATTIMATARRAMPARLFDRFVLYVSNKE
ncbi:MAG: SDR family oxidoreductase [Hyphomicrobiales bacterium]